MTAKRPLQQRIRLACQLNDQLPLQKLGDRPSTESKNATKIPLQCIQTSEDNRFGVSHYNALNQFREQNADINFCLFNRQRRDWHMQDNWSHHPIHDLYHRSKFGVIQADIFRYCSICDMGGFYLDINKMISKSLADFISSTDNGLISFESNWRQLPAPPDCANSMQHPDRYVIQWCFAFAPGHPILKNMIANICEYSKAYEGKIFPNPSEAIRSLTGPGLFTKTVRDYFAISPAPGIRQAGIDFNGSLCHASGSSVSHISLSHYKEIRNESIFLDP